MPGFDWTGALDAMGRGHDLVGAKKVREMCDAMGWPQPPLSPAEVDEVARLRQSAARSLAAAEEIELRPADA